MGQLKATKTRIHPEQFYLALGHGVPLRHSVRREIGLYSDDRRPELQDSSQLIDRSQRTKTLVAKETNVKEEFRVQSDGGLDGEGRALGGGAAQGGRRHC